MADSQTVLKALVDVDPGFTGLVDTLFGGAVDVDDLWTFLYDNGPIAKAMPDGPDVSTGRLMPYKKRRSGTLVSRQQFDREIGKAIFDPNKPSRFARRAQEFTSSAAKGATDNLDGSVNNAAKRAEGLIGNAESSSTRLIATADKVGGRLIRRASVGAGLALTAPVAAHGMLKRRSQPSPTKQLAINKADEITWEGEISKVDVDKRQVFGWASVVSKGGVPIVDRQGDYMEAEEIEKAAYNFVINSRKGGDQHQRAGEEPFHASDMIESFVVTPEKIEKMGLPEDTPVGWWVGFKVNNDDTWAKVKKGDVTGFSIHGRGKRTEVMA